MTIVQNLDDSSDNSSWFFQLAAANAESMTAVETAHRKDQEPHLMNLNEDPMLSGVVFHYLKDGETSVGRKDADQPPDITLSGLRFANAVF